MLSPKMTNKPEHNVLSSWRTQTTRRSFPRVCVWRKQRPEWSVISARWASAAQLIFFLFLITWTVAVTCLRLLQTLSPQENAELRLQRLREESPVLQKFLQKLESAETACSPPAAESEAAVASEVSPFPVRTLNWVMRSCRFASLASLALSGC